MLCNSARLVKNEHSKFIDQPMLFGHANEIARSHRGSVCTGPSRQDFDSHRFEIRGVDNRLTGHPEFARAESMPHIVGHLQPAFHFGIDVFAVYRDPASSAAFCIVHSNIGTAQKLIARQILDVR